jgi:hypothetical protein
MWAKRSLDASSIFDVNYGTKFWTGQQFDGPIASE